jgi:hypothetical protein
VAGGEQDKCRADEEACNEQRKKANALSEECRRDLDKVLPLLANAA